MTSTAARPARAEGTLPNSPAHEGLTTLDVLGLGAAGVLAVVAWASLALAHLGHHSLPAVVAVSAPVVAAVAAAVLRWARPVVVRDRAGLLVGLGCAAVALALTMPGFSYGAADKDPGVYVSHAVSIARTGDWAVHDDLLAHTRTDPTFFVRYSSPGTRLPGLWVDDAPAGRIVPQFYHLWPALLATAYDLDGVQGIRAATPLVGALSVLLLCALLRRAGGLLGAGRRTAVTIAGVGGLLLATNMLQVWQARYPTTETLSQALFLATLLGLVVAIQDRWAPAAVLAGVTLGVGWLNRGDGFLLVLLAAGLGAVVAALGRWDRRAWWVVAGFAVVLPHALLQAYDLAWTYTRLNGVPSLPTMTVLVLGSLGTGALLHRVVPGPLARLESAMLAPRTQRAVGAAVVAAVVGLIVLGFLRPRLFGADYMTSNGQVLRSFNEQSLRRLSWFFTLPAFGLLPVGVAVVALRRWRAGLWAVTATTLLLFPLYAYSGHNSSRLMWWTRRYVPTVLPGVVVLLSLALGFGLLWRLRGRAVLRVPSLLVAAALVAVFLHQSLPVRRHDEFRGSFQLSAQVTALAHGQRGIFLWESDQACCGGPTLLLASTLWLQHGQDSALLVPEHAGIGLTRMAMLTSYRKAFPHRPLFVVSGNGGLPAGIDPGAVQQVADLHAALPVWDESDTARPSHAHTLDEQVQVWRVTA